MNWHTVIAALLAGIGFIAAVGAMSMFALDMSDRRHPTWRTFVPAVVALIALAFFMGMTT